MMLVHRHRALYADTGHAWTKVVNSGDARRRIEPWDGEKYSKGKSNRMRARMSCSSNATRANAQK